MAASPEVIEPGKLPPVKARGEKQRAYLEATREAFNAMNPNSPRPVGRPSTYTDEQAREICRLIAEGNSLASICKRDDMPNITTIYDWQRQFPEFAKGYSKARQDAADTLADEILRISDELEHATDPIQIQAARLRVESRRWIASRLKPQTWGDKAQVEVTGADGAPLPMVSVTFVQPGQKLVEGEIIEGGKV